MNQFEIAIIAMEAARAKIDKDGGLKPLLSRNGNGMGFMLDISKVAACIKEDLCSMSVIRLMGLLGVSKPTIYSILNSTTVSVSETTKDKLLRRYGERILK